MEDLLCKAFDEVYEHEFDKYKKGRFHFFSFRHRRMMKELFSRLETKNVPAGSAYQEYQYVPKKKRPSALIIAIIVSAMLTITASAIVIYGFGFEGHPTHTIVFSENVENAPIIIRQVYTIDAPPDGYTEAERYEGVAIVTVRYTSENNNESLHFQQFVKPTFRPHINTEGYEIIETDVNGHSGFYVENEEHMLLIWDQGDYILSLIGNFSKDELIEIAKSVKYLKDINQDC